MALTVLLAKKKRRAAAANNAGGNYGDAVPQDVRFLDAVGGQQDAPLAADLEDRVPERVAGVRVATYSRLVKQQHLEHRNRTMF